MEVTVFGSKHWLGKHAYTVPVPLNIGKTVNVDLGFEVYNDTNYSNMVHWFTAFNHKNELPFSLWENLVKPNLCDN